MKKEIAAPTPAAGKPPEMNISGPSDNKLIVRLAGNWRIGQPIPSLVEMEKQLKSDPQVHKITFDTSQIAGWDSSLLTFLIDITQLGTRQKISIDKAGLPDGVSQLLTIAAAVPEKKDTGRDTARESFLTRVGEGATIFFQSAAEMLGFIGDAFVTFLKMFVGKTCFRGYDLILLIRQCGADALPIVTLISLLVGLILAFVGAVQLAMFGAQIYVANLVGIAMVRVLGAVMTGIIMAGRTGAAFAAQLGTMQVNEELDALEVLGISPMEFLVLPRMLALILMMPLLCLYADLMGVMGGLIVGVTMLDINVMEYYNQSISALRLNDLFIGLFHSAVFGVLVALTGCLRGMQCGRSASAVGQATTSAVVTGIVSITVATAIITVLCSVLGL
ncbi:MAG: ABC transporter permease [Deltaproteobacteria bacterium]|nr:ABC transporter permease [Deltaproteobacteria bacterium]